MEEDMSGDTADPSMSSMQTNTERDDITLKAIEDRCDALTNEETVEKKVALAVLKLHHAMESQLTMLRREKDAEIEHLKRELMMERLSRSRSDAIDTITHVCERHTAEISNLGKNLDSMRDMLSELENSIHVHASTFTNIEARLNSKKR